MKTNTASLSVLSVLVIAALLVVGESQCGPNFLGMCRSMPEGV
jgi:hypothetical protein